ncbi:hemerythrin domain-containing protein [Bradyrhizobium sp. SZCCHNRI1029]|uniref:hemerythrin domain-containing protein n=1 Tax=Bradyrhizobium sp. SZCCHNRI1029 TaxID=3057278 RepID=UPI002915C81A|nr:hemerythrin domain-containing protein [Bradyrhizobium sp. SZCCHNRI1029]
MARIIEALLQEHENLEKLLSVLEHELELFDHNRRPDYDILQSIIAYFEDYPQRCHHPKEEMIFGKLRERDPAAAAAYGDVDDEHETEAQRLRGFADAVNAVLSDQEILRESFHAAVHEFIDSQREHLRKEETLLFPAALRALQAEDWADIDARMSDRKDPLFDGDVAEKFHNLERTILRWEHEAEQARATAG